MPIDPLLYPEPRVRGGAAGGGGVAGSAAASRPFSRVWAIRTRVGLINTRTIRVSPAFVGPAVLGSFAWSLAGVGSGTAKTTWQLGYSAIPATEQGDGPTTTEPPGTRIIDSSDFDDGGNAVAFAGGTAVGFASVGEPAFPVHLNYIINEPQFSLWFMIQSVQNAAQLFNGLLTITNQVAPEALANFR